MKDLVAESDIDYLKSFIYSLKAEWSGKGSYFKKKKTLDDNLNPSG